MYKNFKERKTKTFNCRNSGSNTGYNMIPFGNLTTHALQLSSSAITIGLVKIMVKNICLDCIFKICL